jgi:diguanylate cyclase (GGDEF)-like protein
VVQTGAPENFEVQVSAPGLEGMWLENRVAKHDDGIAVATLDITERVEARQREREREALFRATVNSSLDMVVIMEAVRDADGRIADLSFRHVNARGAAMLGVSEEELTGKRLCELLPTTRASGTFDKLVRVLETGEPLDEEMDVAEGSLGMSAQWIHLQAVAAGERLAITVGDITERRLDLERIRSLALRLSLALRAGHIGTYEFDIKSASASGDSFALELLGFPDGARFSWGQWRARVLPQDLPDAEAQIVAQAMSGGIGKARYRIVHPERGVCCLEVMFETLRDEDGTPTRSVGVMQDVTERVLAEEQMLRQARSDPLTSLPNRTAFFERLDQALARFARTPRPLAVLFADLDQFKQINDTYGHAAGDDVLREVARRLLGSVRGYDMVARIGGDEFTLVLEDVDSLAAAQRLAAKMVAALQAPVEFGAQRIAIGLSIGGAYLVGSPVVAESLMETADTALYEVKRRGRNASVVLQVAPAGAAAG